MNPRVHEFERISIASPIITNVPHCYKTLIIRVPVCVCVCGGVRVGIYENSVLPTKFLGKTKTALKCK